MRVQIDENSATLTSFGSVAHGAYGVPHRLAKSMRSIERADIILGAFTIILAALIAAAFLF